MAAPSDTAVADRPHATALRVLVSIPLAGMGAAPFLPAPLVWGLAHPAFLPGPPAVSLIWVLAALALVWTPAGPRLGAWLVGRVEPALTGRPLLAMVVVPVAGTLLFWFARARTPLLGDGMLISHLLGQGDLQHGFDFLAFHLHARLAQALQIDAAPAAQRLVAVTSTLTGGAWLVAAGWTSRVLAHRPGDGVLLWGLLVFAAPLQLFLGYVECYAQLAVCLLLFAACLLRHLEGRGSLLAASAWFAAALFWHLNALFLAPLLLAAAFWTRPRGADLARRLATVAWPPALALLVAWLVLRAGTGLDGAAIVDGFVAPQAGRRLLNPLTGPRGLADWRLAKDLLNLVLLLVPLPVVLLLVRRRAPQPAPAKLLTAGAVWLLAVAALLNLKLGVARDWDLFAGHAVVVTLAAFASLRPVESRRSLAGLVWIAGLALALPWFAVNADRDAAVARLTAVTADLPSYRHGLALEDLGRWHRERGDLEAAADAYRAAATACPGHARFHLLHGQLRCEQREFELAVGPLRRALALDPDSFLTHRMLLLALSSLGRTEAALVHARALAGTPAEDFEVARAHGVLAERVGAVDEALTAYERALRRAPGRTEVLKRIGELALATGDAARAEGAFRRLLARGEQAPGARLGLARALWERELAAARPDAARLEEILALLETLDVTDDAAAELAAWRDDVRARLAAARDHR